MPGTIEFFCWDVEFELPQEEEVKEWLHDTAQRYRFKILTLGYIFTNDENLLQMNIDHLQHDFYTDILTFDYSLKPKQIIGEIYISLDRVRENAEQFGRTHFRDELHRVMAHGVLHLCGLGDESDEEEAAMRKAEDFALAMRMF